jgi:hypothetical protein
MLSTDNIYIQPHREEQKKVFPFPPSVSEKLLDCRTNPSPIHLQGWGFHYTHQYLRGVGQGEKFLHARDATLNFIYL